MTVSVVKTPQQALGIGINNLELSPKRIVKLYELKKKLKMVTLRELKTMLNVGKR